MELKLSSVRRLPVLSLLAWSTFLACSWTWCIGMFLPVLLVRDYGVWGWVIFAIPNVIGAAAMGWVMRRVSNPALLLERHLPAAVAFSIVTIAFHLFFAFWVVGHLMPVGGLFALGVAAVLFFAGRLALDGDVAAAAAVFALSILAWILFVAYEWRWPLAEMPLRPAAELLWLSPVMIFGFALCPYLDRTFHRAYHAVGPEGSRFTFAMAFGVLFGLMIVFTLTYARAMEEEMTAEKVLVGAVAWALGTHVALQGGFTIAVHLRSPRALWRSGVTVLPAVALAVLVHSIAWGVAPGTDLTTGEVTYRLFMGFYGLLFPAYVWLCMIGFGAAGPTRRAWAVLIVAVIVAVPFYWIGFIHQRPAWLLPGLAIVLLAKLAVPTRRRAELAA